MVIKPITQRIPYKPPIWAREILTKHPLHGRLHLANIPTPIHHVSFFVNHYNESNQNHKSIKSRFEALECNLFIKRDDATGGIELGGNKIRKLEFLLADALAQNYQSVVTIGGEQSNHCRATACACRMVGLEPHLILRTRRKSKILNTKEGGDGTEQKHKEDFGFVGNILYDRMVGSHIYLVSPGEYGRFGSVELVKRVCDMISSSSNENGGQITQSNYKAYPIPVGGSNGIGTWGYIEGVRELVSQLDDQKIDHIIFATGSGGTATGIVLGIALAFESIREPVPQLHAIGVCDDPDYFYQTMASIAEEMGFSHPSGITANEFLKKYVTVHQGKGLGYAQSTEEELEFVTEFALETGVALDPVYSGKALYDFVTNVMVSEEFRKSNILFWHTGGALGMFDKGASLPLDRVSPAVPLDVYGKNK